MILEIDFNSEVPIYEQIVRQIVLGISKGEIELGSQLPSVRALASDIGVNLHTVNKSYQHLQDMGYVEIDRRKGAKILEKLTPLTETRKAQVLDELAYIMADLTNMGFTKAEIESEILSKLNIDDKKKVK